MQLQLTISLPSAPQPLLTMTQLHLPNLILPVKHLISSRSSLLGCTPSKNQTFLFQLRTSHFKRRGSAHLDLKIARRKKACAICQEWVLESEK
jgi:hypothetical protein